MWVPSGKRARVEANLAALRVLADLEAAGGEPSPEQLTALSLWSSWGAVPEVFEGHREDWAELGERVRAALTPEEYNAARTTTMNAHYTDPAVAHAMWQALQAAGEVTGPVLEPGCGSGTFMALAPEGTRMLGVELDPTTARIAAYLNPHAQVRSEGFEKTRFTAEGGSFAAAIGNVPFGGFSLHDPIDNPQGLSIHNHFLAKSVRHLAPGGYALLLTSSFTMDAKRSTARAHIAKYADLVGAVRLPTGAMQRVAGTEALTDLLILRRRDPGTTTTTPRWLNASHVIGQDAEGNPAQVNDYWGDHPENVLGDMSVTTGMYGAGTVRVEPGAHSRAGLADLADRLQALVEQARTDLPFAQGEIPAGVVDVEPGLRVPNPTIADLVPGHVRVNGSAFQAWSGAGWERLKVAASRAGETRALLGLRDAAGQVLASQRDLTTSSQDRADVRAMLGRRYDDYARRYGPISRFELTNPTAVTPKMIQSQVKRQTAAWRAGLPEDIPTTERAELLPPEELVAEWIEDISPRQPVKVQPHLTALRDDPGFGLVLALESYDEDTATATKTPIFFRDVVAQVPERTHAETPADAIAISLEESRRIDLDRVASLLGTDVDDARAQIADLVFADPHTDELVPATLYLAGDVRAKHEEVAALIASGRPDLERHESALAAVVPTDVPLSEVTIRPGVPWIPAEDMSAFCEQTFGVTIVAELVGGGGTWTILDKPGRVLFEPAVEMRFGTSKKSVADLWEATINNSAVTVTKEVDRMREDGTVYTARVTDTEATRAAREKVAAITAAFSAWVHTDPERAKRLEVEYNERFNAYIAPDYTAAGNALRFPGLSAAITPHPYQRAAVARILAEPAALLDHVVGAGKTGTMVMATMELRRTGVASKPWIVVPNHLVAQTAKEFATWYPDSKVMTVATGSDPAQRRTYVARSAAGDWDAVVCPMSVFERINIDPERTARWADEQIDEMRAQLEAVERNSGKKGEARVKAIERQIKAIEKKFAAHAENKDVGLTFESSGADYLFIDEAHNYKNLARASDYRELACVPGSGRATDLDWKLRALREAKIAAAERAGMDVTTYIPAVATFATGTAVANNLSEMWVMQHYLAPEVLDRLGLSMVDAWAQQFTQNVTKMEIGPDGSTWRMKDRVAGIVNAPELIALADRYTDRVTRDQIPAKLPTLAGGERTLVTRAATPEVAEFIKQLASRANNMPSDPSIDNLLKITHEGRMIALDPRTLGMEAESDGGRIGEVATRIMAVHEATGSNVYSDHLGRAHPTLGGLQLVFCDRSTPKGDGTFTVYEALADELVERGLLREQIAFIHDADDDLSRAELFQRCRAGGVSVLIGSTEKMGTGTNVQDRAVALHHMDCPWRPADLEQREGRVIRQGNQNSEVWIFNYVTEGTYDAVMWQIVARKAAFIAQTKTAGASRTLSDVEDDMTISAAAASAIATGDPRIIERAELAENLRSLQALRDAHHSQVGQARAQASFARSDAASAATTLGQLEALAASHSPGSGFVASDGRALRERVDIGTAIITTTLAAGGRLREGETIPLGTAQGVALSVRTRRGFGEMAKTETLIEATECARVATVLTSHPKAWDPVGLSRRIENMLEFVPGAQDRAREQIASSTTKAAQHEAVALTPFDREAELVDVQTRLDVIDAELQMSADDSAITADDGDAFIAGDDLYVLMPEVDDKGRLEAHARGCLREGDVVRGMAWGKTTLHVVTIGDDEIRRVRPYDDPHSEPRPIQADKIEMVSRLASQLTPAQQWAQANDKVLPSSRGSYYGSPIGQYLLIETEEDVVVGTVVDVLGPHAHRPEGWKLRTEDGMVTVANTQAARLHRPHDRPAGSEVYDPAHPGLRVGSWTPEPLTVSAGGKVVPAGSYIGLEDMGGSMSLSEVVRGPDGELLPVAPYHLQRYSKQFQPPVEGDLSTENFALHQRLQPVRYINDLLVGDVVDARVLDPKAKLDRQVRILRHGGPASGKVDLAYAPVEGGEVTHLRRDGGATITLHSRRSAALSQIDTLRMANPDARSQRLSELVEGATGVRAWGKPEGEPVGLYEGTYAGSHTAQTGHYGSRITMHTLELDSGGTVVMRDCPAVITGPPPSPNAATDPQSAALIHHELALQGREGPGI